MPIAIEYGTSIEATPQRTLPDCSHCNRPFQIGQRALSLCDRWAHRSYLIHPSCEAALFDLADYWSDRLQPPRMYS